MHTLQKLYMMCMSSVMKGNALFIDYADLLTWYFINGPSAMSQKAEVEVLESLKVDSRFYRDAYTADNVHVLFSK